MREADIRTLNRLGVEQSPFFFVISYDTRQLLLFPEKDWKAGGLFAGFPGFQIPMPELHVDQPLSFAKCPESLSVFKRKFDVVMHHLQIGNSFLTNLTLPTPITSNYTLSDIYQAAQSKYKVYLPGKFVSFSPETFVRIYDGHIYSHPMKGTIDATVPNAADMILADEKEKAEHVTIVDLIRNDLSLIAHEVQVTRFRYLEEVITHEKRLLQVSSEIRGKLPPDWQAQLGTILHRLLPAGSISGAPKPKTLEIIQEAEGYERGFYTGIAGHYDGKSLDTCVLIRFIEQTPNGLIFKSGAGITVRSVAEREYQEIIDKVYVPVY